VVVERSVQHNDYPRASKLREGEQVEVELAVEVEVKPEDVEGEQVDRKLDPAAMVDLDIMAKSRLRKSQR
jgi:hypothetical protein